MDYKKYLNENGFIVLENLISKADCKHYRSLLNRDCLKYEKYHAKSDASEKQGLQNKSLEKVVYNLHNKDISWFKLFEHPKVLAVLDTVLKDGSYNGADPYYLNNISARCPLKGNPGQQLHLDSRMAGINYCIVANVLWVLDDFTLENGATRILPGSHKNMSYAENGKVYDAEIRVTAEEGSAIIFNANLWHGGGPNLDGSSRWALALGYARWFIKPSFDYMKNTPNDIYEQLTDSQKAILGFNLTPPRDEFTRVRRISSEYAVPEKYNLPN